MPDRREGAPALVAIEFVAALLAASCHRQSSQFESSISFGGEVFEKAKVDGGGEHAISKSGGVIVSGHLQYRTESPNKQPADPPSQLPAISISISIIRTTTTVGPRLSWTVENHSVDRTESHLDRAHGASDQVGVDKDLRPTQGQASE